MPAQNRIADRDSSGGAPVLGNSEKLTNLWLTFAEERGENAAEPFGTAGKQQVFHRSVNRRTADHRDPLELCIGDGHLLRVEAEDEDNRRFGKVGAKVIAGAKHA